MLLWTAMLSIYMYVICLRYHMIQKGLNVQRYVFYTGSILLDLCRCFVNGLHKVKFVFSIVGQVINVPHGPLVLFWGGGCVGLFVCFDFFLGCVLRHSSNNIRVLFDNSSWKMKETKLFFLITLLKLQTLRIIFREDALILPGMKIAIVEHF